MVVTRRMITSVSRQIRRPYTIANLFMLVKMLMFCRRMTTQSNGALGLMGIGLMSIV